MSITYSYFSAVFTILLFFVALSFVVHASKSFFFADGKSKKFKRDCVSVALCIIALSFMCTCMFICIFIIWTIYGPAICISDSIHWLRGVQRRIGLCAHSFCAFITLFIR
eukprot:255358_1